MAKLTAEQRLERVHMKIMQDKNLCLFSGVIMVGDVKVSDTVPTACTNGITRSDAQVLQASCYLQTFAAAKTRLN